MGPVARHAAGIVNAPIDLLSEPRRIERPRARSPEAAFGLASLVVALAVWEAAGRALALAFLPPASVVLAASARLIGEGDLMRNLAASLVSLAIGYAASAVTGLGLGWLMARYKKAEWFFDLWVTALLAAPSIVFAPVLFALLGSGRETQIAVIVLHALPVIATSTMSGFRTAHASLIDMARAFGATERQLLSSVFLPSAVPHTVAGLRLGLARAVKGMINAEMFIVIYGVGAMLKTHGIRFDIAGVYGILLVIVALAVALDAAVRSIERRAMRWMEP